MLEGMVKTQQQMIAGFTAGEREYIRRELDRFFSTLPTVADGFQLRVWRGGPQAGEPKLPPSAKSLVARGLMRLDATQRLPRLFFTEAGLSALREMMSDRRLADPVKFAHVRRELGIDFGPSKAAAE
jgi:2-hydroxychromene-2-carboxylate isomerase